MLHNDLVPNSQRDDFEPSAVYNEMKKALSEWAGRINKKYRRGTSEATSALRNLTKFLDEYLELLAMPRELIMFRYHFEENGTTAQWQKLYRALSEEQKKELMIFVSHTVSELRILPCPEQFKKILPFYLIKYNGKTEQLSDDAVQLSFMDDSDVVIEEE